MAEAVEKYICCHCSELLPVTSFYKSYSSFHRNGHLPICKECFNRNVKLHLENENYKSSKKAMQRMCMAFDIYFDEDLFDRCDKNDDINIVIGNYLKRLNMAQYKGKTFEDTLEKIDYLSGDRKLIREKRIAVVDQYGNEVEEEIKIKPADIEKWGLGFELSDYEILNSHYKYLKAANPRSDGNQEIFIMDCCYAKLQQLKAVQEKRLDDFAKMTDVYAKSYKQGGLKATNDSSFHDDFTIGVTAETIEKYTPAEYYKNKQLYKDVDKIGEYAERHIFRPLRNIILGTKDKDEEYFVKDSDEEDLNDYDE